MKILLVDDDATNRLVLNAYLKKDGYETVVAENGQQAVDVFIKEQPSMVLMDVMMPIMDGYEATAQIKEISTKFIPIIFLTAMTDEQALSKCVEVGGDDFLTKPYSRVILNAKIEALIRVSKLYNQVIEQHEALENHQIQEQQEQRVARNVFNSLMNAGALDKDVFHTHISPVSLFNGDVVLTTVKPSGGLQVLFGDFTGHGLGAALGALPVSETFYAMSNKSYGIADICKEINKKLKHQLPIGMFLACCVLELDVVNGVLKVWNGAIPGAYILRKTGETVLIKSTNLPFAILNNNEFDSTPTVFEIFDGDKIVLSTDGILEAENTTGAMYGSARFEEQIEGGAAEDDLLNKIMKSVDEFAGGQEANDDITLAIIDSDFHYIDSLTSDETSEVNIIDSDWNVDFKLHSSTLRKVDPLPLLNHIISYFMGERAKNTQVNMIFTELCCNAIDHGLLELDSEMKSTPTGFMEFYEKKTQGLDELASGYIDVKLSNVVTNGESILTITFEDTGKGFDISALQHDTMVENDSYSGRGYPLLVSYCESVTYNDIGNKVECVYKY